MNPPEFDALQRETNQAVLDCGAPLERMRIVAQAVTNERRHLLKAIAEQARALDLAVQMRAAQRRYFATRNRATLDESRRLEREFDDLVDPAPMLPGMEVSR